MAVGGRTLCWLNLVIANKQKGRKDNEAILKYKNSVYH